jgi:hypothetical protein
MTDYEINQPGMIDRIKETIESYNPKAYKDQRIQPLKFNYRPDGASGETFELSSKFFHIGRYKLLTVVAFVWHRLTNNTVMVSEQYAPSMNAEPITGSHGVEYIRHFEQYIKETVGPGATIVIKAKNKKWGTLLSQDGYRKEAYSNKYSKILFPSEAKETLRCQSRQKS